jgi:triphosphoribosyl-dephospho-CoA synthase
MTTPVPPLTPGDCATLACIWEATAHKPGNVYRGADFDDCTYADFLTSAAVIGPAIDAAAQTGVGAAVLAAVAATRAAVGTNTNLGMLLLFAPLAAVPRHVRLTDGVGGVLRQLSTEDARLAYDAIRLAQPGGLGDAPEADVNAAEAPPITLAEAMRLAADRDLVARQYANEFAEVFRTAERIATAASERPLGDAIVRGYLQLLREEPDTLVARKCGRERAQEAADRAAVVSAAVEADDPDAERLMADFDFWLRSDGHRRNPGTSADIVAAALFVLLRDGGLKWPVRFY